MPVGILLITHEGVGQALIHNASATLGFCPLESMVMSVTRECDPDNLTTQAIDWRDKLDTGEGVLVLTDIYGSTPSNIACALERETDVAIVSGVNLPMLIRVLNYPNLGLQELVDKALSGGREGIMHCKLENS